MERELAVQLHWGLWHCEGSCFHYFMSNVLSKYQNLRLRNRWGFLVTHTCLIWLTANLSSKLSSQSNDSISHFSKMSKNIMCLHLHDKAFLQLWKLWLSSIESKRQNTVASLRRHKVCRGRMLEWLCSPWSFISCCQPGCTVEEYNSNQSTYRNIWYYITSIIYFFLMNPCA